MSDTDLNLPLFVDLDGTLIKSDVSYESFLYFIKKNPLNLFKAFFWATKGKPYLEHKIAEVVDLNSKNAPFNQEFLKYLKEEKEKGRKLILASASDIKYVEDVANEVDIFDWVIATNNGMNIAGQNKVNAILDYCKANSLKPEYAYAGNSHADISVWDSAKESILVTDDKVFAGRVSKRITFSRKFIFGNQTRALLRALRAHQWSKNFLLFVPLIMAHKVFEVDILISVLMAFCAFSFAASSIYIVNDILDIEADRAHRTKKLRPLASGALQIRTALLMIPLLLLSCLFITFALPFEFSVCLFLYLMTTVLYSFYLKRIPVLDIIVLALLYVLRLFAGSMASGVFVSEWLMSFSLFAFTSLACLKRFSELNIVKCDDTNRSLGRGYKVSDIEPISQFGTASGYLAVFVLVFYINSKEVLTLYRQPKLLWLLCPVVLYWFTRIWIMAYRSRVHDDPVVFALKDKVSYYVGLIAACILFFAI